MNDVRNLQAMLSEGITDPALLYPKIAPKREPELPWREGEPSDDELYNGHGMEGGISYGK